MMPRRGILVPLAGSAPSRFFWDSHFYVRADSYKSLSCSLTAVPALAVLLFLCQFVSFLPLGTIFVPY